MSLILIILMFPNRWVLNIRLLSLLHFRVWDLCRLLNFYADTRCIEASSQNRIELCCCCIFQFHWENRKNHHLQCNPAINIQNAYLYSFILVWQWMDNRILLVFLFSILKISTFDVLKPYFFIHILKHIFFMFFYSRPKILFPSVLLLIWI